MQEQALKLLVGAGDIHVHTSPSLVPNRKSDIWELVRACEEYKMAFAIVKWHHGDSFSAAQVVNQAHGGPFTLYGGLVLNHTVGGLNPYAVDVALTLGAKIVWLPTLDAKGHAQALGTLGGFPFQQVTRQRLPQKGISILRDDNQLEEAVKDILMLLHKSQAVLASGHVTKEEIFALSRYIKQENLDINLLVNHIDFSVPHLTAKDVVELSAPHVWFELAYFTISKLGHSKIESIKNLLESNPSAQFVLASDSGQSVNPISPHAMRLFVELLLENGMTKEYVENLLHHQTRKLLKI